MFNPTQLVIDAFVDQLQRMYQRVYGAVELGCPGIKGSWGTSSSPSQCRQRQDCGHGGRIIDLRHICHTSRSSSGSIAFFLIK
jgi:hypothetical protein